jgi:hypothetical protein
MADEREVGDREKFLNNVAGFAKQACAANPGVRSIALLVDFANNDNEIIWEDGSGVDVGSADIQTVLGSMALTAKLVEHQNALLLQHHEGLSRAVYNLRNERNRLGKEIEAYDLEISSRKGPDSEEEQEEEAEKAEDERLPSDGGSPGEPGGRVGSILNHSDKKDPPKESGASS